MPKIAPFKATFPAKGFENQVAIDSNQNFTKDKLIKILQENPFSYYHVFKPQTHFPENISLKNSFAFGKKYFAQLKEQNVLVKDELPALYVYQIINPDKSSFLGLISTVDVNDYDKGVIKKHENTITEKQNKLFNHIEINNLIGEPILLTYPAKSNIKKMLFSYIEKAADIDFDFNGTQHKYWKITDSSSIEQFQNEFSEVEAFYIADGHHRTASVCQFVKEKGLSPFNLLTYLVSDEQLKTYPFYRLFKTDEQIDSDEFIEKVKSNFIVEDAVENEKLDTYSFLIFMKGKILKAKLKSDFDFSNLNVSEKLNVSILEDLILKPILDVEDSRDDSRLTFLSGKIDRSDIKKKIDSGKSTIAFALASLTAEDIFEISNHKLVMPPKSTFVEPKLLSGSLILEY